VNLTAALVTFGIIFLAELPDKTMVASLVMGSRYRPLYVWAGVAAAFLVHVTLAVAAGSVLTLLPRRVVDAVAMVLFAVGAVLVYREGNEDEHSEPEQAQAELDASAKAALPTGEPAWVATGPRHLAKGDAGPVTTGGSEPRQASSGAGDRGAEAAVPDGSRPEASRGFWKVTATSFAVIFVAEMGDLTQISTANLAARFDSPVMVWLGALLALWSVAAIAIAGGRGLLRIIPVKVITRVAATAFVVLAVISLVDVIRG
jgi:putative Ca2+/H+ antiporter (TMEM165/GDT1 family)